MSSRKKNKIQSIIFSKTYFTKTKATNYLKKHGHKSSDIDETKNFYRFRQNKPLRTNKYFTKNIRPGLFYIIVIN